MSEPGVVTPEEAARQIRQIEAEDIGRHHVSVGYRELLHTVATEPERIAVAERRGAVKALRDLARSLGGPTIWGGAALAADAEMLTKRADAIENGADL